MRSQNSILGRLRRYYGHLLRFAPGTTRVNTATIFFMPAVDYCSMAHIINKAHGTHAIADSGLKVGIGWSIMHDRHFDVYSPILSRHDVTLTLFTYRSSSILPAVSRRFGLRSGGGSWRDITRRYRTPLCRRRAARHSRAATASRPILITSSLSSSSRASRNWRVGIYTDGPGLAYARLSKYSSLRRLFLAIMAFRRRRKRG